MTKKFQTNIGNFFFGGNHTFLDLWKGSAYEWEAFSDLYSSNTSPGFYSDIYPVELLTSKGYPTVTSGTRDDGTTFTWVQSVFLSVDPALRSGNVVFEWSGAGSNCTVWIPPNSPVVGSNGSIEFAPNPNPDGGGFFLNGFRIYGGSAPTNVRAYYKADKSLLDAGEIWNPTFLSHLAPYKTLRYLDWVPVNGAVACKTADIMPLDYCSYTHPYRRPNSNGGVATNNGSNVYTVASPPFAGAPTDKQAILVRFAGSLVSGGPAATLVTNGVSKPIMNRFIQPLTWNSSTDGPIDKNYQPVDTRHGYAVFDAYLDVWIMRYNVRGDGLIHPNLMIDLAKKVGANVWAPFPMMALDPQTDAVTDITTMYKNGLANTGLKFLTAAANEVWNDAVSYPATRYGWAMENKRTNTTNNDQNNWMGRVSSKLAQTVGPIFGNDRSKYEVVIDCWTLPFAEGNAGLQDARFESTTLVNEGGTGAIAAKTLCDGASITSYWNTRHQNGDATEQAYAAAWAAASTQAEKNVIIRKYILDNGLGDGNFVGYKNFVAKCNQKGITYKRFYEGGYSPDYNQSNEINLFRAASKKAVELYHLEYCNFLFAQAAGATEPSFLVVAGAFVSNPWAVKEDVYGPETPGSQSILDSSTKDYSRLTKVIKCS